MKVKVNIINMCCILIAEAVNVPSLMMMTLIVSEELLERDRQRDRWSGVILKFSKSFRTLKVSKRTN